MNEQGAAPDDKNPRESPEEKAGTMCPMASMCGRFFDGTPSRFLLMLPGAGLILLGVAILLQPQILVWLVAIGAVLLGCAALMMARIAYRVAAKRSVIGG